MSHGPLFRYFYLPWGAGVLFMLLYLAWWNTSPSPPLPLVEAGVTTPTTSVPPTPVTFTQPYFPGCANLTGEEKQNCSREEMYHYIYQHTTYPAGKPIHKTAGIVVADFIISPKGEVKDIRLHREPTRNQGLDVVRILREMKENGIRWEPATRNGRPISWRLAITVRYNMVWAG